MDDQSLFFDESNSSEIFNFDPFLINTSQSAAATTHDLFFAPFDTTSTFSSDIDAFDPIPQAILFNNNNSLKPTAPAYSPLQNQIFQEEELIPSSPALPTPPPISLTHPLGACIVCYKAKKQCDQKRPCSRCQRLGKPELCTERPRKRKPKRQIAKIRALEASNQIGRKSSLSSGEKKIHLTTLPKELYLQQPTIVPPPPTTVIIPKFSEISGGPSPSGRLTPTTKNPSPSSSLLPTNPVPYLDTFLEAFHVDSKSTNTTTTTDTNSSSTTTFSAPSSPDESSSSPESQSPSAHDIKFLKHEEPSGTFVKPASVALASFHGHTIEDCPKMREDFADPIHRIQVRLFNLHIQDLFDSSHRPSQQLKPDDNPQLDLVSVAKVLPKARVSLRILDEKSLASPYHAAIGLQISLRKLDSWAFCVDYIINQEAERLFGYSREECISHITLHHKQFISRLIARDDWDKVSKVQADAWSDGAPGFRLSVTCLNKWQTKFRCLLDARVELHYEDNNPKDLPPTPGTSLPFSSLAPPKAKNVPISIGEQLSSRIHDKGQELYSRWVAVKRVVFFFIPLPPEQ